MCCVLSHSVMSDSLWPHGLQPARLLCPWGFSRQENWSRLPCPLSGDLPNPGIEPQSPTFHVNSLLTESLGKSKNTGVGSLSILQGIIPTQELNRGLLHWRQILYQLSYQECQLINIKGIIALEKHPLAIPTEIINSGKESQWMLKSLGKSFLGEMIFLRKKI